MCRINLFLDSSALFAGIVSATGAARAILLLAESEQIKITVSEQVITETERAIARKIPKAVNDLRQTILSSKVQIIHDPPPEEVRANADLISHPADVPIVLAAMEVEADYLVTLNRKHFIDDPDVALQSGLRIGTPGDALEWVRGEITSEGQ